MKKGDFIWIAALLVWVIILVVPSSRAVFISVTDAHPYAGGFIKFAILASMGDMLGIRVIKGEWTAPKGLMYKALVWGIIGLMVQFWHRLFLEAVL